MSYSITYNYPGNGYITSASDASFSDLRCNPPVPTGTACKIVVTQSNKVTTSTVTNYTMTVNSYYATQWAGWQYAASSSVSASVSSRGRSANPNYIVTIDNIEEFIDPNLVGTSLE